MTEYILIAVIAAIPICIGAFAYFVPTSD